MDAPADNDGYENDNDGNENNNDGNDNDNDGNNGEIVPQQDNGNNGAATPQPRGGNNGANGPKEADEKSSSESESSESSSSSSSSGSSSSSNRSRRRKSSKKSRKSKAGLSVRKVRKIFKELEAESLKKKLEECTRTPKGNRKVDRQLYDKDGNEIVTPKNVKSSGKSVSGTSSSKKRKFEDDSDSSHEADDVDLTISKIEKRYLTPTKVPESESEGENQYDFLETSTTKAGLGRKTSKRLKRCHENYTSKGPPMLSDNPTVKIFYAWKAT